MKRHFSILALFLAIVLFAENPKYIFLFIGDGMSAPQRTLSEEFSKATNRGEIIFNHFPVNAATRTCSANKLITDSAASGTAIACGSKTNNGVLGMAPDMKTPLVSTAYVAKEAGKKVAIITSVTINHATPGAFYAHRPNRGQYYQIGLDLIASNFDFFGGGDASQFDDKKCPDYKGNLHDLAREAGYYVSYVNSPEDMAKINNSMKKVWIYGKEGTALPCAIDNNNQKLHLADFVKKGIECVDNPKGFFMMCEGGAIDWGGHANDPGYTVHELLELNNAVKVAYEFAQQHPKETLIVVTGDHETGSLTLGFANMGIKGNIALLDHQKCTAGQAVRFITSAKKSKKENFSFADAQAVITKYFGLKFEGDAKDPMLLTAAEIEQLKKAFQKQYFPAKDEKPINMATVILKIFSQHIGFTYSSFNHTALPSLTSAYGCQAERFAGKMAGDILTKIDPQAPVADYENTFISQTLKELVK